MWSWLFENVRAFLIVAGSLLGFAAEAAPYVDHVFERARGDEIVRTATLEARVRVVDPEGHRDISPVDIEVRNTSNTAYDLEVAISEELARSYDNVAMVPEPSHPEESPWSVRLERVLPGEARLVALELQGARPGPHDGLVRIVTSAAEGTGDEVAIPVRTFTP